MKQKMQSATFFDCRSCEKMRLNV